MKRHQGFITLSLTMILLMLLSSVLVFIGKVLLTERRITLNELEYRVAFFAAEHGITSAIARFKVEPHHELLTGSLAHPISDVSYQVNATEHATELGVSELVAHAQLADGARSRLSMQLAARSVLNPLSLGPPAPVILGDSATQLDGRLTIVANPSGSGDGVALSLWSSGDLTGAGSLQSCYHGDYDASSGQCEAPMSDNQGAQGLGEDVLTQDSQLADDLLDYVFGYGAEQWASLQALARATVSDCADIQQPGFYIVTAAECRLDQVVSTPQAPVIVLAKDTAIYASSNTTFYGLLFSYATSSPQTLALGSGSRIVGAVVGNKLHISGDFTVIHDSDLMCVLTGCEPLSGNDPFRSLHVLAGSWHDG